MPGEDFGRAPRYGARRPRGALEAEILGVLQRAAPQALTSTETLEYLGGGLAPSTVTTVLTRLYDKRLVTRTKHGNAYAYALALRR